MTVTTARKPLGQLLVAKGVLQPQQLERALEEQRRGNHQKLLGEIVDRASNAPSWAAADMTGGPPR